MKRSLSILLILLAFAGGIFAIELMKRDSGYVLVSLYGVSLETSFWFAAFCIVALLALVVVLWRLITWLLLVFFASRGWFVGRRSMRIEQRYRQALLYYLTDNFVEATKQFSKLGRSNELPVVRTLAEARSLLACGEGDKALNLLNQAELKYPQDHAWLLKLRTEILLDLKRLQEARAILARLKIVNPNDPVTLKLEQRLLRDGQQIHQATALLPKLERSKQLNKNALLREYQINIQELANKAQLEVEELDEFWQQIPKKLKRDHSLLAVYCRLLLVTKQHTKLEQLINFELMHSWQAPLVKIYAKLEVGDRAAQLKNTELWIKQYGEHAELLLTAGVLALKNQFWGKARDYLEKSFAAQPCAEALYLQGFIAEHLGEKERSFELYKQAASLV